VLHQTTRSVEPSIFQIEVNSFLSQLENLAEMVQAAIYLHSSWRAASTYVWAKFRQRPDAYCYFEPLNEHLATATPEFIDSFRPWTNAHHPKLDAPYLEEFRPLIYPGGGIPGFPRPLTFGRYCVGDDTVLPELESYLAKLGGHASRLGRRPVYGFVRTDLRVGWFRANTAGTHIFIRRDPRRQFLSMVNQAKQGNAYFLLCCLFILTQNLDEPAFASLFSVIDVPALVKSHGVREFAQRRFVHDAPLRELYVIFYFMRLLARQLGEARCDLVIDIDRLSLDASYRHVIEVRVGDLTGMPISFADCQVECYEKHLRWSAAFFEELEREIETVQGAVAPFTPPDSGLIGSAHQTSILR
jgi:hypothetical protein